MILGRRRFVGRPGEHLRMFVKTRDELTFLLKVDHRPLRAAWRVKLAGVVPLRLLRPPLNSR